MKHTLAHNLCYALARAFLAFPHEPVWIPHAVSYPL